MGRAIAEFDLITEGDKIMVCLSGGKDSYTMLSLLERFRRRAPIHFELLAVHLDQVQPNYDGTPLRNWLDQSGFAYEILREDTYSVVKRNVADGATYCSVCSRLRRGVLYNAAERFECTKIALGHHRDDTIETLLLNLFYTGSLRAMPPKLVSDDRRNVVIRPLFYAAEASIAQYATLMDYPILPCELCGSQEQLKRKRVKSLLTELTEFAPQVRESMLAALTNVRPSQLADVTLWKGLNLPVAQGMTTARTSGTEARKRLPLLKK